MSRRPKPTPPTPPEAPVEARSRTTIIRRKLENGKTEGQDLAEMAVAGAGINSYTTFEFSSRFYNNTLDLGDLMTAVLDETTRVKNGDMSGPEGLLVAQAVTLNAMFAELALRAKNNFGHSFEVMERYLRLAFKAQTQCRSTVEAIAILKNPPLFAKQANIAGLQQINNSIQVEAGRAREALAPAPIEVLEGHVERVDSGTESAAGSRDQGLEAVAAINRTEDGRRESQGLQKRVQGRPAVKVPRARASAQRMSRPTDRTVGQQR